MHLTLGSRRQLASTSQCIDSQWYCDLSRRLVYMLMSFTRSPMTPVQGLLLSERGSFGMMFTKLSNHTVSMFSEDALLASASQVSFLTAIM